MEKKEAARNKHTLRSIFGLRNIFSAVLGRNYFSKNNHAAFTLVELLVAIAITGVLAASLFAVLNPAEQFKKAHDVQRKNDLEQVKNALDAYYGDYNLYPPNLSSLSTAVNGQVYIQKVPKDPLGQDYCYETMGNGISYRLSAQLERSSDPQFISSGINCNGSSYSYAVTSTDTSVVAYGTPIPTFTPAPTLGTKSNGETCSLGGECASSYCVDSTCCNTACIVSTCQRCDSYSNAGAGTCGYVSSSVQDPDNECGTSNCYTGNCKGDSYACGYYTSGQHGCASGYQCNGSGTCAGVNCDADGDGHLKVACGGDDCNDNCATCYPGSTAYTYFLDGKDQDCNGIVDDVVKYLLFATNGYYGANLGGRTGADTTCNSDTNKPASCTSSAWAFLSVNASDEIRDMPTTKGVNTSVEWYWQCTSSKRAATSWADLLDGTIENYAMSAGCQNAYTWVGSTYSGELSGNNCLGWTTNDPPGYYYGGQGQTGSSYSQWLDNGSFYCYGTSLLYCACASSYK